MIQSDTLAPAALLVTVANATMATGALNNTSNLNDPAPSTAGSYVLDQNGADPASDEWRVDFNSWIWMIGVEGSAGVRGQSADVDASFGDILDASDSLFAFSGRLEVGRDRWAGYFDAWYGKLGADDQSGPMGAANIDVQFEQVVVDFGAMYRVTEWEPQGSAQANRIDGAVDLYAGGRYNYVDLELAPARLPSVSRDEGWVDPIVGARLMLPVSEQLHLRLNGDVGGFGVSSDFTWSCTAVLGVDFELFSFPSTFYGGYRAIGWDYSEGSGAEQFDWDVTMHGPLLGLSIRF